MTRIAVIDDDASIRESLEMFLRERSFDVRCAETASQGLQMLVEYRPQVVVLDIRLPDGSGLELLPPLKALLPEARVVLITAFHDMETTIEAMRLGAFDYIHKPLDVDELEDAIGRAAHVADEHLIVNDASAAKSESAAGNRLVGKSRAMRHIFKSIGILIQNRATVLIEGETGTGKEVVARVIHERSPYRALPFITVDCTTLVDTLMESELFGHEQGAFTGAVKTKKGRLELAGEGTLFFDEVGELPPAMQSKLLRFLERREFTRVGGIATLHSHARILAATNRNLEDLTLAGRFRRDLFFRLKVVNLRIPPLRERLEDLDELVPFFMRRINRELRTGVMKLERDAMDVLRGHVWSGNVRELINVLTKGIIETRGEVLTAHAVRSTLNARETDPAALPELAPLSETERRHIERTMCVTGWNVSAAAKALGVSRPTLRKRLEKYHLRRPAHPISRPS